LRQYDIQVMIPRALMPYSYTPTNTYIQITWNTDVEIRTYTVGLKMPCANRALREHSKKYIQKHPGNTRW